MRTTLTTAVLLLLGLAPGFARAGDLASPARYTRDGTASLVQKDLEGERWTITYVIATGQVTGNVRRDDGSAVFLDCDRTELRDDGTAVFSCWAADGCETECHPEDWKPAGNPELPLSFFFPPSATTYCCELPLPTGATTCAQQGASPQACVSVGSGTHISDARCVLTTEKCSPEIETCYVGSCVSVP